MIPQLLCPQDTFTQEEIEALGSGGGGGGVQDGAVSLSLQLTPQVLCLNSSLIMEVSSQKDLFSL